MFAELGIVFPPGPAAVETAIARGASIVVAGDPPVAFAAVITLDGHPHLEQISVRADQTRSGIGSLLLASVVRDYGPGLTLLTFRDVPWNGPWYRRQGFAELPESAWGPELRRHWQAEIDAGLPRDVRPRHLAARPPPAILTDATRWALNYVSLSVLGIRTNRALKGPKVMQRRKVMRSEPLMPPYGRSLTGSRASLAALRADEVGHDTAQTGACLRGRCWSCIPRARPYHARGEQPLKFRLGCHAVPRASR